MNGILSDAKRNPEEGASRITEPGGLFTDNIYGEQVASGFVRHPDFQGHVTFFIGTDRARERAAFSILNEDSSFFAQPMITEIIRSVFVCA